MISNFRVDGMTCEHCVSAVTQEVSAIPGVDDAAVDLVTGSLVVSSGEPIDVALIEAAVDEAGDYTVTAA